MALVSAVVALAVSSCGAGQGDGRRDGSGGPAAGVEHRTGPGAAPPGSLRPLPGAVRQAVRVTRSDAYCPQVYCAVIDAWQKDADGRWAVARPAGSTGPMRAQIGRNGFARPGAKRGGDRRTPTGVFRIITTFSTDARNPGTRMPWRQRRPTSNVSGSSGRFYNTWREIPGARGDRPSMRYGVWVDYNHGRLTPGRGAAPAPGRGSGIFLHLNNPTAENAPSLACVTTTGGYLRWLLTWLDPATEPRVLLNL